MYTVWTKTQLNIEIENQQASNKNNDAEQSLCQSCVDFLLKPVSKPLKLYI